VQPVGGAFSAPSKDLCENALLAFLHRSGRMHRLARLSSTVPMAAGRTIGGWVDLPHPPRRAAIALMPPPWVRAACRGRASSALSA
jgi:hypothetical protein